MIVPTSKGAATQSEKTGCSRPPVLRQREPGVPRGGAGTAPSCLIGAGKFPNFKMMGEAWADPAKIVKTRLIRQDIDTSWFFIAKEGRFVLKEN